MVEDDDSLLDLQHDVQRQVIEALDRGDALHEESMASARQLFDDNDDADTDTMDDMQGLY